MLCIGVKKIKIHFDTSQLCCGVVHLFLRVLSFVIPAKAGIQMSFPRRRESRCHSREGGNPDVIPAKAGIQMSFPRRRESRYNRDE
jgi:hypothetical protein